jgi:1-acyl-sn-glycerol-3-phosphate acyltransferase
LNELPPFIGGEFWKDALSPFWVAFSKPLRNWLIRRKQRIVEIEVEGADAVKTLLDDGTGVLITPNHSAHSDVYLVYELANRIGRHFHVMAAAQVFAANHPIMRWMLRKHGCFSIDRSGADMRALKRAIEVLAKSRCPLLIFPEGEVYHLNARVTPFKDGAAMVALMAAKRAERPTYCVPCAFRYTYASDPKPELLEMMSQLEQFSSWRPRPDMPLVDRVLRFAAGQLALKEVEYMGVPRAGTLAERLDGLRNAILDPLEQRHELAGKNASVPERAKALRRACNDLIEAGEDGKEIDHEQISNDLNDIFVVTQLFSYTGDYLANDPAIERIAETIDKLEEDILQIPFATIRATRKVKITLGEPVDVKSFGKGSARKLAPKLTQELEERVQALVGQE